MVDSATGYGTDRFYHAKGSFIELACKQLQKWKNVGNEVKIICPKMQVAPLSSSLPFLSILTTLASPNAQRFLVQDGNSNPAASYLVIRLS